MPLFDFVCINKDCCEFGVSWEEIIPSFDSENPTCPICLGPAERKVLQSRAASFQWGKGGGWN